MLSCDNTICYPRHSKFVAEMKLGVTTFTHGDRGECSQHLLRGRRIRGGRLKTTIINVQPNTSNCFQLKYP